MIIEFSIGNYKSIRDIQTLSFRATGLVSENKDVDTCNIFDAAGQNYLRTVGVYGANASGKSNLLTGLVFLAQMVQYSLETESFLEEWIRPNRQSIALNEHYGYFQIVLLLNGRKYRYGFVLGETYIENEWLFGPAGKNETWYFKRTKDAVEVNKAKFPEGAGIPYESKLRPNALFLSFCSSYNGDVSGEIKHFLARKLNIEYSIPFSDRFQETNALVKEGKKEQVLQWLRSAGLFFNDIYIEQQQAEHAARRRVTERVKLIKNDFDKQGNIVGNIEMDLLAEESLGTQKYYSFIGKLFTLFEQGGILISDEIDSNFHPTLLQRIIRMFNDITLNKANAQLLFSSHDTNLMNPDMMRRDQFYFTEKSVTDNTVLYSLADLKGIRNNADFAKQYLAGYYGALPILSHYAKDITHKEQL